MINECFVKTALYRYATSKWTPIICLLLRTTFNFGVVIEGCRCVVSSVNWMMLFLHLCWFGFTLIVFPVWFCPLCLSSISLVTWVSCDICVHPSSCIKSSFMQIYPFTYFNKEGDGWTWVWSHQVCTKCTLWPFFVKKKKKKILVMLLLLAKRLAMVKIPQSLWKYRIVNYSIKP